MMSVGYLSVTMAKVNAEVTGTVQRVGRVLATIIQKGVTMALSFSRPD